MCFVIRSEKKPKVKIAKKDIRVYKVIGSSGHGIYYNLMGRRDTIIQWKKGYLYKDKIGRLKLFFDLWEINEGLHSFKKRKDANELVISSHGRTIVIMYIPKGAKYYENGHQYLSNQLVWY